METIKYIASLFCFYFRGTITIENGFVKMRVPKIVLGFIPLGSKKESIPVTQISSTQSSFRIKPLKLIIAVILGFFSYILFDGKMLDGIVFLIISALLFLDAFEINLQIVMTSGQTRIIEFIIADISKAHKIESAINSAIANSQNNMNARLNTNQI